jgi:siroheme synthase-like protein
MSEVIIENKNQLFPVFLKLQDLRVLLVGGGNVGLEKLQALLGNSPATHITIVAPVIKDDLQNLVNLHSNCIVVQRPFEEADIENKDLVICATDDKELHCHIKQLANAKGLLVNVADTPDSVRLLSWFNCTKREPENCYLNKWQISYRLRKE